MSLLENTVEIIEQEDKKSIILKRFFKPLNILIMIVVILILSTFIYIKWQNHTISNLKEENAELIKRLENPLVVEPVSPTIVLDIVESEFEGIDELSTIEYLFSDASRFTDSHQIGNWNVPLTEKSFSLKWNGVIKAGIHLEEVDYAVINSTIKVTIPSAEIFSYDVDEESVELLDEKNNVFNPISVDDKLKFDADTEQFMKERAIQNGILEKAQENAKIILLNLLVSNPLIGSNYTIEFSFLSN